MQALSILRNKRGRKYYKVKANVYAVIGNILYGQKQYEQDIGTPVVFKKRQVKLYMKCYFIASQARRAENIIERIYRIWNIVDAYGE
jgi:hypothetical protein